ncbi:MAG: hypothetical protein JNM00_04760 [Flavobacteriales bacterium]|nr:hypothetical protein [Flavobacteriales bacterium]
MTVGDKKEKGGFGFPFLFDAGDKLTSDEGSGLYLQHIGHSHNKKKKTHENL